MTGLSPADLLDKHPLTVDQIAYLKGLTPQDLAFIAVYYGGQIAAALFAARTVVTYLGRKTGLSHPDHWRRWPRVPWRTPYRAWQAISSWYERQFHIGKKSTGGFSGLLSTLTLLYKPDRVFLGRAQGFGVGLIQLIGITVKRHLYFYAMTGSGKTTYLVSLISTWYGSVSLIDPKAQIVNALHRHDWRKWYVWDLDDISDAVSISINFFDCLKEAIKRNGPDAAVKWALRIAAALIATPAGSRTPYFFDVSRQYLAALILHVLTAHPEDEHNLPYVRDLIVQGYRVYDDSGSLVSTDAEAHQLLHRMMSKNDAYDGVIAGGAAALASASGETGGNVRSTLQDQTKSLDLPKVRRKMLTTTVPISTMKTRGDVVFAVTAGLSSIRQELQPIMRLWTNMVAYTFEDVKKKKGQCLTVVDELPSQGYNETLEVTLAAARSYGQVFLGISQNIELMQKNYPHSWKSFSGEADAVLWAGCNHQDSAEHLSRLLGKKTVIEKDQRSGHKTRREIDAMDPDQIKRFLNPNSDNLIVTRAGDRALKLKNEPYFKALPVWKYAPDPEHKETFLRRVSRFLFDRKRRPSAKPHVPVAENDTDSFSVESEHAAADQEENIVQFPNSKQKRDERPTGKYTP